MSIISIGLIIGFFAGFICGLFGMGGGSLMVPAIYHFFGSIFPIDNRMKISIGTSLFVIIFSSISAIISYSKNKKIKTKLIFLIVPSGIIGSQFGAFLISKIEDRVVKYIFVFLTILLGLRMFFTSENKEDENSDTNSYNKLAGIAIGFFSGFVSGLCGVGGAVLIIPLLYIFLKISIHYAIGTALIAILFNSISGSIAYIIRDLIDIKIGISLALTSVIGAQIGAKIGLNLPKKSLRKVFSIILILSGTSVVFRK
ncbi:MAG: sulfite exporter TauE/SafE family protein [Candidatus Omnitrophica bacterium]|nr:sulfite exporter TauE/SafE family protein [Candidatus Omnitrophota bacterium]MCM8803149.1 sulfite exporter TauE/SafE family protein [Candidatus Omnitrophota bacterium]